MSHVCVLALFYRVSRVMFFLVARIPFGFFAFSFPRKLIFRSRTALPNGSGRGGSFSDDFAAADPEGAAAVLSGVKSILAGGASFVSTGVNKLGSFATASAVDGGDDVDPLLGQPLRKAASVPLYALSDEERVAIEAEERSKSAAYAAVDLKSKTQKQM
jgi:hypothetical protein